MTGCIDLNADLGESSDANAITRDIAIMEVVTSANIACGGHAGSEKLMIAMLEAAKKNGVSAGAHPAYPDRENFGRVSMHIGHDRLFASLCAQMDTLKKLADERSISINQVKPHGALYNNAADNPALAKLVTAAAHRVFPDARLYGLAGSAMADAAREALADFVAEAFIDRQYTPAARLASRSLPGAVLEQEADRIAQALSLTINGKITLPGGGEIAIDAQTLCLHSDSEGALATARAVRGALQSADIEIAAPK
ncbi:MAG: 5-oxoprolinase subunit PxpA [Sphingorhabdus sp.]